MRKLDTLIPIAQGAAGRVYRARDEETGAWVAVKQLRHTDARQLERLRREAASQQRLDHPHVCRIHGLEQDETGRWQLVMEYVEGSTLAAEINALTLEERIRVLEPVCRGVGAAHEAGIVHRDLKPANILLRRTPDDGWHPLVADFGLARGDDDPTMTATGEVVGTPAYMAPEQARGDVGKMSAATDVFAIGCILFEALTGKPPFEGPTISASLDRLLHGEAPHPRSLNPHAPEALCRIALQCLEMDPHRRYQQANAVAGDLQRWLKGAPVAARKFSATYRLVRRARRHPALAAVGTAGGLALLLLGAWSWQNAHQSAVREAASAAMATRLGDVRARMSVARLTPSHDIEIERKALRLELEALAREGDDVAADLLQTTLAEAYLELGDVDEAARHALVAQQAADTPRARAVLARTLLRQYADAVSPWMDLPQLQRDERVAAARDSLIVPARALLDQLAGTGHEPREALARLAIAERRFADAQATIGTMRPQGPGDYAQALLSAELMLAQAEVALRAGDADAAIAGFAAARQSFAEVSAIGRSDPAPRAGSCRAAGGEIRARRAFGGEFPSTLEALDPGCVTLTVVDGTSASSHLVQAAALAALASAFDGVNNREQARSLARAGLEAVSRARALAPDDPAALELEARAFHALAGLEPEPADTGQAHFDAAIAAVKALQETTPEDPSAYLLRGIIERDRARHRELYDRDPAVAFAAAAEAFDQALALTPESRAVLTEAALNAVFRFYDDRDEDPPAALRWARRAIELQDRALALDPDNVDGLFDQGANHGDLWNFLRLTPELAPEIDRAALKMRALELLARVRELAPDRPLGYTQAIMIWLTDADYRAERGLDSTTAVRAALALLEASQSQEIVLDRDLVTWVRVSEVRADLAAGRDPAASIVAAWQALDASAADSSDQFYVRLNELELAGLEVRWLREMGQADRERPIERGMLAFEALVASERRQAGVLCGGGRILLERSLFGAEGAVASRARATELFEQCLQRDDDFADRYAHDLALLAREDQP